MIAIIGGMLGFSFNYMLGYYLSRYQLRMRIRDTAYAKTQAIFHKYGIFLLFFCWVFPGNIVVMIAGFLKTPAKIAFPLIFTGIALHYGILLGK
jgi:membrane protein YqaA with SNARE-associated domain